MFVFFVRAKPSKDNLTAPDNFSITAPPRVIVNSVPDTSAIEALDCESPPHTPEDNQQPFRWPLRRGDTSVDVSASSTFAAREGGRTLSQSRPESRSRSRSQGSSSSISPRTTTATTSLPTFSPQEGTDHSSLAKEALPFFRLKDSQEGDPELPPKPNTRPAPPKKPTKAQPPPPLKSQVKDYTFSSHIQATATESSHGLQHSVSYSNFQPSVLPEKQTLRHSQSHPRLTAHLPLFPSPSVSRQSPVSSSSNTQRSSATSGSLLSSSPRPLSPSSRPKLAGSLVKKARGRFKDLISIKNDIEGDKDIGEDER